MIFLPSRTKPESDGADPGNGPFSRGCRAIIDLLDVVHGMRDGEHLQCIMFLAQEFGLLAAPVFLFGSTAIDPRRPHSLLLDEHFLTLLRDGIVDVDGAGRLRLRHDLFALPSSGLAGCRLSALSSLSPAEAAIFAAAVLRLAGEGRYAGSSRHSDAFRDTVGHLAASTAEGQPIDATAICEARHHLMSTQPVLLAPA